MAKKKQGKNESNKITLKSSDVNEVAQEVM